MGWTVNWPSKRHAACNMQAVWPGGFLDLAIRRGQTGKRSVACSLGPGIDNRGASTSQRSLVTGPAIGTCGRRRLDGSDGRLGLFFGGGWPAQGGAASRCCHEAQFGIGVRWANHGRSWHVWRKPHYCSRLFFRQLTSEPSSPAPLWLQANAFKCPEPNVTAGPLANDRRPA